MNANSLLASPTGLSPYLRFGCLSCRLFYYRLWDLYKKVSAAERTGVFWACREAFPRAEVWVLSRDSGEEATSERWQSQAQPRPPMETKSSFSRSRTGRPQGVSLGWQHCQQQGGED